MTSPTRILVVDDNEDMRLTLQLVLQQAGYEVTVAPHGGRALELQRKQPADLLVTDIFMPEIDGLETIVQFKREFPKARIIAMSGGSDRVKHADMFVTATALGVDALLRKPFEPEQLLQAVRKIGV